MNLKNFITKNSIGLFIGRFQPPHNGHKQIAEHMAKNHKEAYVILVKGKKSSQDKEKNPFKEQTQVMLLNSFLPKNVKVIVASSGFMPEIIKDIESETFTLYCGPDRVKTYAGQLKYVDEIDKIMDIKKLDFDRGGVSATKVREAIKNDDEETFRSLTPSETHKYFKLLKKVMNKNVS